MPPIASSQAFRQDVRIVLPAIQPADIISRLTQQRERRVSFLLRIELMQLDAPCRVPARNSLAGAAKNFFFSHFCVQPNEMDRSARLRNKSLY
jgi:hypothetical protein